MVSSLKKYGFHEWLCKTNFSFLMGASHPHEIVDAFQRTGYHSLCINDFDGVYGLARTYTEFKKKKLLPPQSTHQQLHYGAEIHLKPDHHQPLLLQETLVLIAKNQQGYQNLCSILTLAHKQGKSNAFLSIEELLRQPLAGLFAIQPMRGNAFQIDKKQFFKNLSDSFQKQFFFAISRPLHPSHDCWIPSVLKRCKDLDIPYLISQDIFFHKPDRKPLCDTLHAIRTNQPLHQAQAHFLPNSEFYFHTLEHIARLYKDLPQVHKSLELSYNLHQQCVFSLKQLKYHYPKEMIPKGLQAQDYLEKIIAKKIHSYKNPDKRKSLSHIVKKELCLIKELEYADYFLTVWDIVRWARQHNILCQGRGSAANSAVCFLLGITATDPSLFDLLFERFMSRERGDPPDIDVDFEHERREEVIQYIYQRYGRHRAAMVANVITFRRKGSLRAVGQALGFEEKFLSKASHCASHKNFRAQHISKILKHVQTLFPKNNHNPRDWTLWGQLAQQLKGFPRHMGIHSGGFMLSDKNLNCLVPVEPATMEGRSVVQWCKEDIESLYFFKIDILSLGMLTALRKSFSLIETFYQKKLSLYNIPHDDDKTYKMIQKAETVGTFQIESRAQMSMLPRLKPQTFYDLVIEIAIIRPGPIQGGVIHPYLKRRQGLEPITYPDPRLKPILEKTHGIAIFQEQAMRIAMILGDFTPGEANELRKHIGSWNVKDFERDLNPWLQKLARGLEKNSIEKKFAQQILKQMQGFSQYGFPESHSISFAFLAYASCYLKCHYPAAFFCSILNSQPMGFYSPHVLLKTARKSGVLNFPICILKSQWDHQLETLPEHSPQPHHPPSPAIRLGFRLIRGLSKKTMEHLTQVRSRTPIWHTLENFLQDCPIPRNEFSSLAAANAFQCFGLSRKEALWKAAALPLNPLIEIHEDSIPWMKESPLEQLQQDFRSMNTSLTGHPIPLLRRTQWDFDFPVENIKTSKELNILASQTQVTVFGMTLIKQAPPSAKGMVFLTLEDETGFINLAIPPGVYRRTHMIIEEMPFLCLQGQLQKNGSAHSILVNKVYSRTQHKNIVPIISKKTAHPRNQRIHIPPSKSYT